MNPLQSLLDEYLALRRALGHKLRGQGQELQQFVAFAGERGRITSPWIWQWVG